jgi:ligand-binding SRPBCC domain-containing protein
MPDTFTTSQWTPFPVELVFAFFANPANLPHLMQRWQQGRIETSRLVAPPPRPLASDPELQFKSQAAGEGSEMTISFRPFRGLPYRTTWQVRIIEFAWFSHFRDIQVKGPFASWEHRHTIVAEAREDAEGKPVNGTLITDTIEYTPPMGPIGSMSNSLFLRRQMEATFAYRQRRLEEILPVASRQATRRS